MKGKITIAVCVAAIAGYVAYTYFFRGAAEDESANVRASFNSLSLGIASGNMQMAQSFLAPDFTDAKISKEDFLKVLAIRRKVYNARITSVTMQGDLASVSYTRTEVRGEDGEPINSKVVGETWLRDKKKPGVWKLGKLAEGDTWSRSMEIPKKATQLAQAETSQSVLGALEKGEARPTSMKPEERYNPVGRRDPFRALVAISGVEAEVIAEDLCEPDRPRELLEGFDLDSLKLAGIIETDKGPVALIETPDGKGYTVYKNMYVGKRCGKVVEMQPDFILLKEKIRKPGAAPGKFTTIDTPLQLRREEG
ncbi:MAG: pilus assembly protein PilP [Nitrospinae bacterium]|nr:pilus assembly protein PilP [Nitrospinota bacterium]